MTIGNVSEEEPRRLGQKTFEARTTVRENDPVLISQWPALAFG